MIDDDLSVIVSFNMDMRSTYLDTELMLVIRSKEINKQLEDGMMEYAVSYTHLDVYKRQHLSCRRRLKVRMRKCL